MFEEIALCTCTFFFNYKDNGLALFWLVAIKVKGMDGPGMIYLRRRMITCCFSLAVELGGSVWEAQRP